MLYNFFSDIKVSKGFIRNYNDYLRLHLLYIYKIKIMLTIILMYLKRSVHFRFLKNLKINNIWVPTVFITCR